MRKTIHRRPCSVVPRLSFGDYSKDIVDVGARGGIRDVSAIEGISIRKVLSVLLGSAYMLNPKQSYYESLEIDEFWTYVGKKQNKVWFIYAYHRPSGEIVAYPWGKRTASRKS